jgi:hypothetical protein
MPSDSSAPATHNGDAYATSHEALERDEAFMEETRNAARTLLQAVTEMRQGRASLAAPWNRRAKSKPKEPAPISGLVCSRHLFA